MAGITTSLRLLTKPLLLFVSTILLNYNVVIDFGIAFNLRKLRNVDFITEIL